MKRWIAVASRTVMSLVLIGIGAGGFLWMGTPEVKTQAPRPDAPPLVKTTPAARHDSGISFDVDGSVVPFVQVAIAAEVAGRVEAKADNCRAGRTVDKGDVLIKIDSRDYELEVERLTEEFNQAQHMIDELDAELDTLGKQIANAGEQLQIDTKLLARSRDLKSRAAASESEVDAAIKAELTSRTSLDSLLGQKLLLTTRKSRLQSAKSLVQANLKKATRDVERTTIRAPFDGVVVSENVEQDGYVQTGATMFVLQDTSSLDVTCKLHMRQMHWLWQSERDSPEDPDGYEFPVTPAAVIYDLDGVEYAWKAVVDRYDGAGLDSLTRMVPCRVHVDDPTEVLAWEYLSDVERAEALVSVTDREIPSEAGDAPTEAGKIAGGPPKTRLPALLSGMFVRVRVHADPPIPLIRLPQQAVQPGNTIWVVRDGQLASETVAVATSTENDVIVYQQNGSLTEGDEVVISPLVSPVSGMAVSTKEPPKAKKRPGGPWQ